MKGRKQQMYEFSLTLRNIRKWHTHTHKQTLIVEIYVIVYEWNLLSHSIMFTAQFQRNTTKHRY